MKVNTVIIGSGISGLSAAHFLSKKTNDFVVLESQKKIGGIIQTKKEEGFICENGPNTVLLNNDAIIELIKDSGLWDEIILPSEKSNKNRFVLHENRMTKIPTKINSFIKTPLLTISAKLRLIAEPFIKKHKQNTTVYEFIKTRFGIEFHNQLIEPFLTGVYAGDTKKMSAKDSLKLLWKLEQKYGSVFKGLFKEKMSVKDAFNLPNGLFQLIEKISFPIRENIKLGYSVDKIIKHSSGYEVLAGTNSIHCKNIISSIPAHVLGDLIWDNDFSELLKLINYNPIDVFHFGVLKKNIQSKNKGFGVLTKPSDGKSFLGILFSSQIFNHVSPKDRELYTVLVGGERQRELCSLKTEDLKRVVLDEFKDLIKYKGDIPYVSHYKWEKGIPQYHMIQGELVSGIESFEENNQNFHIIGNYFNGISVSDCVKKAKSKVEILNV